MQKDGNLQKSVMAASKLLNQESRVGELFPFAYSPPRIFDVLCHNQLILGARKLLSSM
jgi:hypothetical protein